VSKVLITGAAGFLGRNFVKHHLLAGDDVTGVDDMSSTGARWWPEQREHDYHMDAELFFASQSGTYDLAYHFAAPVGGRLKIENDPLYNAHSLSLDEAFFRWAIEHTKTAVYPSSSAVYGTIHQGSNSGCLNEVLFDPRSDQWDVPDEMYGFTKMAGEVLAEKASRYGLSTLCIRPFSGYGNEQSFDYPVPSICARALRREDPLVVWGSGHQTRDFIHVSDIVGATAAALARGIEGYQAINLGSGVATSFVQIAEMAADIIGYRPVITTDESKPEGVMSRYSDPSRMLAIYQPTVGLRDGLAQVIDSIR
jgi:nucleoside-diphosphate-sugar epimerase